MPETFEKAVEACIERIQKGSASIESCLRDFPQYKDELREMLPLAISLNSLKHTGPSASFSRNAVNRLVSKLPEHPVTFWESIRLMFTKHHLYSARRLRMPQIIISVLAVISMLVGGSFGVQAAAPGDLFYQVDRGLEAARLRITANIENNIALRTQYASERLEEAQKKMEKNEYQYALTAVEAYGQSINEIAALIQNEDSPTRDQLRTMTQEEIALQQGTLDRIRLNWPDDAQARTALQNALQRSNMGVDFLLGAPEFAPQGPSEDAPQGPANEDAQGPNEEAPQGPNDEAPQGPTEEAPQGPNNEAPTGPNDEAPAGPTEEAPQGPNEDAPLGPNGGAPAGP